VRFLFWFVGGFLGSNLITNWWHRDEGPKARPEERRGVGVWKGRVLVSFGESKGGESVHWKGLEVNVRQDEPARPQRVLSVDLGGDLPGLLGERQLHPERREAEQPAITGGLAARGSRRTPIGICQPKGKKRSQSPILHRHPPTSSSNIKSFITNSSSSSSSSSAAKWRSW